MKRFLALLLITISLSSVGIGSEPAISESEMLYPTYEGIIVANSEEDVRLCSAFLDLYEPEILEIFDLLVSWRETYQVVQYQLFEGGREWYAVNGETRDGWQELPFQKELLDFRDRFQCKGFDWECDHWWCDCGPVLDLTMKIAENGSNTLGGSLLYVPGGSIENHAPGPYAAIPGHDGWYAYYILEE